MRTMQTKGAALAILALLLVSASCTSTKSAGPGPAESIIPVATEYGSMAEMQAVLAAAGLTCAGAPEPGWGTLGGVPDVTPAESLSCWIGEGQPAPGSVNTLILRFDAASDLERSDNALIATKCGSVAPGAEPPKLKPVAEGATWEVGDSGTHGGIWGPADEAADAPVIRAAADQIAKALGGRVVSRTC
jgi:hypothetical protein